MSKHPILLVSSALVLLCSQLAFAEAPRVIEDSEVAAGQQLRSEEAGLFGEIFQWPAGARTALADAEVGSTLILQGFPVAPGERLRTQLRRYDLYAPEARTHLITSGQSSPSRELPRTRRLHFRGHSLDDPSLRVALSFDPDTAHVKGILVGPDGHRYEILAAPDTPGSHLLRDSRHAERQANVELQAHCDADILPGGTSSARPAADQTLQQKVEALGVPVLTAVVAIDTDNEFHHLKFNNDTTAATDYIADLFNEMNVMYERDVLLRLLIGDTFFRLDTDSPPTYDDDPFNNTDSPASAAALNEFGTYWQNNQSAVERVFALLLSGKSSASNSASGIAWVDGYCETQNTGGGYSVNQIFRGNFPVINDARLVGHELGHNHGSPHTHCYNPPIDECSSIGNGCYDGSNGFNCPPEGPGTVMSYCNFSASNCGPNRMDFHPTVIAQVGGLIVVHTFPGCIEPLVAPGTVFFDGFELGNVTNWSNSVP